MLSIVTGLLSSAGFGSVIGLAGGVLNRHLDLKSKQSDQEFELKKMDKEREYIKEEFEHKARVATVEGEAKVESEGYKALAASYNFAVTTEKDGWVDKFTKLIRPLLTLAFFVLSIFVFYKINELFEQMGNYPTSADITIIWMEMIRWIMFQAGVAIGWWFAMRPNRGSMFGGK